MKIITPQKKKIKFKANKHRPEIRDNLDSRINEEQESKGDGSTHNRNEQRKPVKGNPGTRR